MGHNQYLADRFEMKIQFVDTDIRSFMNDFIHKYCKTHPSMTKDMAESIFTNPMVTKLKLSVNLPDTFRENVYCSVWDVSLSGYFPEFEEIMGFSL